MGLKSSNYEPTKSPFFIQEGEITDAKIIYGFVTETEPPRTYDIALGLIVKLTKKDNTSYTKEIYIKGDYKKEGDLVTEWGSAFKIASNLANLGIPRFETDDLGIIPADIIRQAIGKRIFILSYIYEKSDGTAGYRTYDFVHVDKNKLLARFEKNAANEKYPPYKYKPELASDAFPPENTEPTPPVRGNVI